MRTTRRLFLGTLVIGSVLAFGTGTRAAETVTCQDGTTSKSGRGACSHHGGVAKTAGAETGTGAAQKAAPAATVTCKDGTASKPGRGACSHHGGIAATSTPPAAVPASVGSAPSAKVPTSGGAPKSPTAGSAETDPSGATAQCKDGTYSHAQHHQGACSHQGGVANWLR